MKRVLKIIIVLFFLAFGFNSINAQVNLIINGDFEQHDTCPNLFSNKISLALGWNAALLTPDYYNGCSTYPPFSVPSNERGYQPDYNGGSGYAGITVFINNSNNKEYMQTKLINTLSAGTKYIDSMYVNKSNDVDYAIATMGMLFTDTIINLGSSQSCINTIPQIKNNFLLYDTLNWILVQDTFVAVGNELYLTIGNFNTNATSDSVKMPGTWTYSGFTYNFIDNVSLFKIDGTCNNYWNAGFDKYILVGDSTRLGAINTDNSSYLWQNSAGGNTYLSNNTDAKPWSKPLQTTTYYVKKTCPNNNVFIDTVTVYVQQTVGIKQFANNIEVNVYPNPANSKIYVEAKEIKEVKLFDLLGNEVISTIKGREIEVSNLSEGIYFIEVATDKNISTQKIIIQH